MNADTKTISIITVALNEERHVVRWMDAVKALEVPDGLRVEAVLVDGGSSDGTASRAEAVGIDHVISLPGANIPVCRNAGVEEAQGDLIAFVDTDCELSPDWLIRGMKHVDVDQPVIVGWPVMPPENGSWVQQAWYMHWRYKNPAAQSDDVVTAQAFRLITTRNMLLTRKAFHVLAGFDEALATGEDTDFVFRAQAQGMNVCGVPGMMVVHHGEPANLREFFRQQLWHANRTSYRKIAQATGARVGGNAPLYTAVFLAGSVLAAGGSVLALVLRNALWLWAVLPVSVVVSGPAIVIATRSRRPYLFFRLLPLYTLYGIARSMDLLGLGRKKTSWKRRLAR